MSGAVDPFDLGGKVALVSGASRGIGEAIASRLAAHGAHVIVTSRKRDECERVVEAIRAAGGSAEAAACHIGSPDDIDALFDGPVAGAGLDILVNNAAANPYFGPIADTDPGAFQKVVDVNIRGYFLMSARGAKAMARRGGGAIVNIASVNGVTPGIHQGIYSISKAAVISMTKAFAVECAGDNIRANAVLPGLTDTKFASVLVSDAAARGAVLGHVPMNRIAHPDEIAGAVLYLASPAASYTTGAILNVDGGFLAA